LHCSKGQYPFAQCWSWAFVLIIIHGAMYCTRTPLKIDLLIPRRSILPNTEPYLYLRPSMSGSMSFLRTPPSFLPSFCIKVKFVRRLAGRHLNVSIPYHPSEDIYIYICLAGKSTPKMVAKITWTFLNGSGN